MSKTRVGAVFKDALHIGKAKNKNEDLEAHVVRYYELQTRIRALLTNLQNEHSTMLKYFKARAKVANQINILTEGTPLSEAAGGSPEPAPVEKEIDSYCSMHKELAKKAQNRAEEFQKLVINYVTEWDSAVTTRVEADMKKYVTLRHDLDHYEEKVDYLKNRKTQDEDKVNRNVDKQTQASDTYENHVAEMRILLEEITERSWKDLIPLLARMAAWDKQSTEQEMACMAKMNEVVDKVAVVAVIYEMEGCHEGEKSRFQKLAVGEEPTTLLSPQNSPQKQLAGDHDEVKGNYYESAESSDGDEESASSE